VIVVVALGFPANAEEGNAEDGVAANALITENPVDGKSGELESDMSEFRIQDPRLPTFREVVIVYFAEMPSSLNELALKCGGRLIFVKEDIKMAAFETSSMAIPGETSQTGLDFVSQALKDPCVEKAFRDPFMFGAPDSRLSPDPFIRYPEEFEKNGWEYAPNMVSVGFWRLPPSLEEFASTYGGRLLRFDEVLLFATFETSDMTEFIKKVSADPYVRTAGPNGISQICSEPTDPLWGD
jgi:serine protease